MAWTFTLLTKRPRGRTHSGESWNPVFVKRRLDAGACPVSYTAFAGMTAFKRRFFYQRISDSGH